MRVRDARIAGALYLLSVVVGWFCLRYLPDRLVADAAHGFLFRIAVAGDLVCGVVWLAVVLALYRLFENVDRFAALLMLVLGAFMQVPLYFVNAVNYYAMLIFSTNADVATAFSQAQRAALANVFLSLHDAQFLASLVFGGLWLFPFAALVWQSRVVPRFLAVWLALNGVAWLAVAFVGFLAPQDNPITGTLTAPLLLGEIVTALWLTIAPRRAQVLVS
jgi:hypothetical protein